MTAETVSHRSTFELVNLDGYSISAPVQVTLAWSSKSPFAVELTFRARQGPVEWTVSRELLAEGLDSPVGVGDIRLGPDVDDPQNLMWLLLCSPSGRCEFQVLRADLVGFLAATFKRVPAGAEGLADYWWEKEAVS